MRPLSNALLSTTCFCVLCAAAGARDGPRKGRHLLGSYDFVTGKGERLAATLTPEGEFTVGDYDGHRLLRIVPRMTAPVVIRDGQQEPAFPHVNPEKAGKKVDIRVNLKLLDKNSRGIDPKELQDVMVVLDLYDVGYKGTFGSRHFSVFGHGKARRDGIAFGVASGSDWGHMPMTRARMRKRAYLLRNVFLDGRAKGAKGADVSIKIHSHLLVRSVSLFRVDITHYDLFESRLRALNKRQIPLLRKRALVEDRAGQARMTVFYLSLSGAASGGLRKSVASMALARAEVLRALEEMETATDEFFFQGRLAAIRGDLPTVERTYKAIAGRVEAIDEKLGELDARSDRTAAQAMRAVRKQERYWWFSPLRTSPPTMPFVGHKINPKERILFCGADGGYAYKHNWKLPYATSLGVNVRHLWYMYPGLNEDGRSFQAYRSDDTRQAAFNQEYMNDSGSSVLTYRHFYILPIPGWFKKRFAGKTDIWAWNGAGEVKGRPNGFNDEVRKLFVDHHREIARRHRYSPKWNLPLLSTEGMQYCASGGGCENGYSPSAVKKFRQYLRKIYSHIMRLNAELGTDYAGFEAIKPPPDMGITVRRRPGPLDYHFERFRRQCLVDVYEMCAKAMKEENPEFRTWFESMARFDLTPAHGLDTYNMFRVSDMGSTHSQGEFNPIWNMSIHRYFPGSTYAKQEHFPSENESHCDPDVEMLRAAIHAGWAQELICGNRGLGLWSEPKGYRRSLETYGPYMHEGRNDVVPYRHCGVPAVFRKRADMWLPLLNNLRWKDPKVGMLYSVTTQIVGWPYQETEFEGLNLHQWLFRTSIPYFVVHEDAIADTRESLGNYRVIVAPYAPLTQREIGRKWLNWIRVGGVLLSSGPFGVYDQYGKEDLTVLRAVFGEGLKVGYATDEIAVSGKNRLDAASIAYLRKNGIMDVDSVSGWFWDVSVDKLPETARVLLRLEDGRPVLLEGEHEGGRVVFSTCGGFANQLGTLYMSQLRRRIVPFAQPTRQYGLTAFPLTDAAHHLYMAVINFDYYNTVRDTLTLDAAVRRVVDVGLEHGFPVPFKAGATTSTIELELPPGRCALLDLGFEADMTWEVRQINEDVGRPSAPLPDIYTAKLKSIAASALPPNAKREAWALMSLARRWASRRVKARAGEYVRRSGAMDKEPDFVSFDGDRVRAKRLDKPIAIDGKLDDWAKAITYSLKGSATSGGKFQAAYDDRHLYLAVAVRDAHVKDLGEQGSGVNWVYACDGVQVALNPCDTTGKVPTGLVDIALHDGYSCLTFSVSGRMRALPFTNLGPGHARSATRRLEGGYAMEIAIPLEDYYVLPVKGASIGFDVELKGATGTFSRYAKREGRTFDGKRMARLYFE